MNENKDLERPPKEFLFSQLVTKPRTASAGETINVISVEEIRRRKEGLIALYGFFCG